MFSHFSKSEEIEIFDPRTDILNNAINEEGWQILDVREPDEIIEDGNLRDQARVRKSDFENDI